LKKLFSGRFGAYVLAVGLLISATGIGELLTKTTFVDASSVEMLYILSVAIASFYLGFGPAMMLSVLSTLAFDFFFILPLATFAVAEQQDAMRLLILLVVCIAISFLSPRIRP